MFRIKVNHVKSGFFFASKQNEIFASISNFASEAKVRAHPSVEYVHWTIVLLSSWIRGEDARHFSLSLSCVDLCAVRYVDSEKAGHLNLSLA